MGSGLRRVVVTGVGALTSLGLEWASFRGAVAALAARLGYPHVDTGAMYRAVAWKADHAGLPLDAAAAVAALAERAVFDLHDGTRIDGHDVTTAIRTPEVDRLASAVARLPKVRRIGIIIGEPLDFTRFNGLEGDRFVLRSVTDELVYELRALSGQPYVDVYASSVREQRATPSG